jgi:hypothetical protein
MAHRPEVMTTDETRKGELPMAHADPMVHHLHAEKLTDAVARKVAGQKVHHREAMAIGAGLRTNETVVVTGDRADLHAWIINVGLRRGATLAVDHVVAMRKAVTNHVTQARVDPAVSNRTKVADRRRVAAKVESSSDLQCEADDHRSLVADLVQANLRGCRDVEADHHSAVVRRSDEDLREWVHLGRNSANHLVADDRSETVGQVALRWDHPG